MMWCVMDLLRCPGGGRSTNQGGWSPVIWRRAGPQEKGQKGWEGEEKGTEREIRWGGREEGREAEGERERHSGGGVGVACLLKRQHYRVNYGA